MALLGGFDYSQNGGGTFSDFFFIFFSPWLYLLITTSSSLKESGKLVPKSCPQVTQNHHFGSKCSIVENDFDVESRKDYDSVKCNMNSKIDSHRAENANDDGS